MKNFYGSLRNSTANKSKTAPPPVVPSAFAGRKNEFAPPPVRRVASGTPPAPAPKQLQHDQEQEEQEQDQEGQEEGEWAEALYEYTSSVRSPLRFLFAYTF